ncbi:MAG: hypothetical protein J6Z34_04540 [Clostridia bacterium]|nr:hypothetical protein [Clostridia bacterium]
MLVKRIISLAAEIIGLDDEVKYLLGGVTDDLPSREEETEKLLSAYNAALCCVATDYAPLVKRLVAENTKEIPFSAFSDIPAEILSVNDKYGFGVSYTQSAAGVTLDKTRPVTVIEYRYIPEDRGIDDECDYGFFDKITPRALAEGTAAAYLRAAGEFSKAAEWRKAFEESVRACLKPRGKLVLPKRRWL